MLRFRGVACSSNMGSYNKEAKNWHMVCSAMVAGYA